MSKTLYLYTLVIKCINLIRHQAPPLNQPERTTSHPYSIHNSVTYLLPYLFALIFILRLACAAKVISISSLVFRSMQSGNHFILRSFNIMSLARLVELNIGLNMYFVIYVPASLIEWNGAERLLKLLSTGN